MSFTHTRTLSFDVEAQTTAGSEIRAHVITVQPMEFRCRCVHEVRVKLPLGMRHGVRDKRIAAIEQAISQEFCPGCEGE